MTNRTKQRKSDNGVIDEGHTPTLCGPYYTIHLKGHLNSAWTDWLDGLEMKLLENGETVLSGVIVDQAALMGILNELNRLNLTLLSVNEIKTIEQEA